MDPHAGQRVVEAGAPLGQSPVVVILAHGRNAAPEHILDLVPRLARPHVCTGTPPRALT